MFYVDLLVGSPFTSHLFFYVKFCGLMPVKTDHCDIDGVILHYDSRFDTPSCRCVNYSSVCFLFDLFYKHCLRCSLCTRFYGCSWRHHCLPWLILWVLLKVPCMWYWLCHCRVHWTLWLVFWYNFIFTFLNVLFLMRHFLLVVFNVCDDCFSQSQKCLVCRVDFVLWIRFLTF